MRDIADQFQRWVTRWAAKRQHSNRGGAAGPS